MRYVMGVLLPVVLQILVVLLIIALNTGNGSWAGLAALLIGLFAIPATAIANFAYIKSNPESPALNVIAICFLIALAAPFAVLVLQIL